MTSITRGGRGKKAPYGSTHCRVPEPCKATVDTLTNSWKTLVEDDGIEGKAQQLLEAVENTITAEYYGKDVNKNEQLSIPVNEIVEILSEALTYKANAGGKIKDKIKEALALLNVASEQVK